MWTETAKDWYGKDIVGELMNKYLLTEINNITMGFLLEEGKVNEIRSYDEESILGNIYVGRVSNIVKNINAAFVDIAKNKTCYLPLEDYTGKKLKIGDLLTVQINKEPIKTKQPSVTTKISLTGEYVVVHQDNVVGVSAKIKDNARREELKAIFNKAITDFKKKNTAKQSQDMLDFGGIIRTNAEEVADEAIYNETITLLCKLNDVIKISNYATAYSCMQKKLPAYIQDINGFSKHVANDELEIITDIEDIYSSYENYVQEYNSNNNIKASNYVRLYADEMTTMKNFYNLDMVIDKALNSRVYLKSGAYLVIEHTEAMTVIDVNSGKAIKGSSKEDKLYEINIEAAKEIARQLRLRNISGIIVVDFINLENEYNNEQLMKAFKDFVVLDTVPTTVVDMTKLGLIEVTRKRIRKPLYEVCKKK